MIEANDWKKEQERLERVTRQLQAQIANLEPQVSGLLNQVTDFRKHFWEEVTINTGTNEDFEESFHSIKQQEALLSERERSHRQRMRQWNNMKRLLPSPYFGRIDFEEDGIGYMESVYIGVSSFIEEDGLSFLVYDWRSPIASLYYDHSPGAAAYETPGGTIDGVMRLKRQYQIRDGKLLNVFDTSLTIGDELLQQALGKGSDAQMKSIVATIQKEQNAIIRDDKSRMLIVQGAAGSGKTSAALQRVAYLLYKNRERLTADQIVLFSPNPMFNSYVSTVLPELGEENMQQTTFQEYLTHWLQDDMHMEDPFDQIEYVLTAQPSKEYDARLQGIKYKASEAFLEALQSYAATLGREGMKFNAIRFRNRELIGAEQMKKQFYSYDASVRLEHRVAMLQEWLLRELSVLERKERNANWVRDELELLDNEQYDEAYQALLKKHERNAAVFDDITKVYADAYEALSGPKRGEENVFDFADQEEDMLRKIVVKEHFHPLRRDVKQFKFVDVAGLYGQLFAEEADFRRLTGAADLPEFWPEICKQTHEKLERRELFYEDATPFLYVKELVEGVRRNTEVRHVFVDEGQDYSPFQYVFLKRLFPRARMTVLGDFGQAIFVQSTQLHEENSPLVRLYGADETNLIQLVRSYRSTLEIVLFARALLPGGEAIMPFARSGGKPQFVTCGSNDQRASRIAQDIAMLQAEGFDSIAVIAKTAAQSREAYEALTSVGVDELRLITKETLTFEKGIAVVPGYLAKGVEFDAVLVYDASIGTYNKESERKLFYTVCTRAMHRLRLYATEEATPFMREIDQDLYEAEK